jgi:integrase
MIMTTLKENKFNFTKTSILVLNLPDKGKISYYYDVQVNGLGIMLFPSGTKTFFVYKRVNGRPDKIKLGRFPQMTVEEARKSAYSTINEIAKGIDPKEEKAKMAKEMLFSELFDEFLEKHAKLHKKCWQEDEAKYKRHLMPFAKKRISSISKNDIIQLHSSLSKSNGIYSANRVLSLLTTVFNKATDWGWDSSNPCVGIKKFKEKSRERFIQGDEITRFFESLNEEPSEVFRDFFYIALLTGARRDNVQAMHWNDINFNRSEWRIKETKNGEAQTIPLASQAIDILKQRHENRNSDWVFPSSTSKSGHIEEPKRAWKNLLKRAEIEDLRIHDLRRTLGSWQAANGANSYIIGKSLGHKTQQATAIYARLNIDPVRESVTRAVDSMFAATMKK